MLDDRPPITEPQPEWLFAGRYRLIEVLGRGAMGEVHRAFDTKLQRNVAVKLMTSAGRGTDARRAERLMREARAVAALNHPNVVGVYDVGEEGDTPFIVMELVEGDSIATRLKRGDRPDTLQVLDWTEDVGEALAAAHGAGLVHRDIKPENLLVDRAGRVKVVDFGIVKELGDAADQLAHPALTAVGGTVGTPLYMPPEQLRAEPLDGRADQYAWGLVAYELFAGAHPYSLTDPTTTYEMVANDCFIPSPLTEQNPKVPFDVERLIIRTLSADPSARFASMSDVLAALHEAREVSATLRAPTAVGLQASPSAAPPAPRVETIGPGDVIAGKYRVERLLGSGGMGIVVAARHADLDERVAIKLLRSEVAATGVEFAARFSREGRAAAKIRSEHVARILDVGTLDGAVPFLVMEYLEGQDLATLLERHGPLPVADAVDYVLQICEALAEAHAIGIIHRDLKPPNLFLTKRADGSPCVKLLDFGISKMGALPEDKAITHANTLMGSPWYMSPEQLSSPSDVDSRSDIWGIGVTLYQLLTGRVPFDGSSMPELVTKVVTRAPDSIAKLRTEVPSGLDAVVRKCLEKNPLDRFVDVAELSFALEPFAPRRSRVSVERIARVIGRPVGPTPSVAPPRPARTWPIYIAVATAVVALANGTFLVVHARRSPATTLVAPPSSPPPPRAEPPTELTPLPPPSIAPAPTPPALTSVSARPAAVRTPAKRPPAPNPSAVPDDRL